MKLIIAVIQPERLERVMQELDNQEVHLRTVSSVLGVGHEKGHAEFYRGTREVVNMLRKVRLEIAVNEDFVEKTVAAITKGAHSGNIGDGVIFVLDLGECIRISTGERGGKAIG